MKVRPIKAGEAIKNLSDRKVDKAKTLPRSISFMVKEMKMRPADARKLLGGK